MTETQSSSLSSVKFTTSAKGLLQFEVKVYIPEGEDVLHGVDKLRELADRITQRFPAEDYEVAGLTGNK